MTNFILNILSTPGQMQKIPTNKLIIKINTIQLYHRQTIIKLQNPQLCKHMSNGTINKIRFVR
jgi:hypothetical protein